MTALNMPIDVQSSAAHTLRLGDSVKQPTSEERLMTVRYNHKPSITHLDDTTTSIVPASKKGRTLLSLKDGDDEWEYEGHPRHKEHLYVLLQEDATESFVLEKVEVMHSYTLRRTPGQPSATKLAQQYPNFDGSESDPDDIIANDFQDEMADDQEDPDSGNPFDFRHYVTHAPSASQGHAVSDVQATGQEISRAATPISRPSRKPAPALFDQKRKVKPSSEQREDTRPERRKARHSRGDDVSDQNERGTAKSHQRQAKSKAGSRQDDLVMDESGDLVLDGDVPQATSRYQGKRSLGLALAGQFSEGPISLRNAASPLSKGNSPLAPRPGSAVRSQDNIKGVEEGQLQHPSRGMHTSDKRSPGTDHVQAYDEDENDGDADADVDAEPDEDAEMLDNDVEDLQLPSPARAHRPSLDVDLVAADEEDDLEQQMLMAMEADDDEPSTTQPVAHRAESDEESEEE